MLKVSRLSLAAVTVWRSTTIKSKNLFYFGCFSLLLSEEADSFVHRKETGRLRAMKAAVVPVQFHFMFSLFTGSSNNVVPLESENEIPTDFTLISAV